MEINTETKHRFRGIRAVYGEDAFIKFRNAHVFIAGVGGVGSWCIESLVRSGVGHVTIIDNDTIEDSNSNRQLHTMQSTLGQYKADVLRDRLIDISPDAQIDVIKTFMTKNNFKECIPSDADIYIDAIDNITVKAALIAYIHKELKRTVLVSGGAGGKRNPGMVTITDLAHSHNDSLLARLRSVLRREYGYPKLPQEMHLTAIYSTELSRLGKDVSTGEDIPDFGALMCVTATEGLRISGEVLRILAERK